jgi:hypothetical protein
VAALDFVVLLFVFGLSAGLVAKLRGNSFWIWFLIGFAMPIFGTIAALVARSDRNEPRRRCEECGAIMPVHNQVCTHCGADLHTARCGSVPGLGRAPPGLKRPSGGAENRW